MADKVYEQQKIFDYQKKSFDIINGHPLCHD